MLYFFLGLTALVFGLFAAGVFTRADPAVMARRIRRTAGAALLAFAAFLTARGAAALAVPVGLFGWWLITGRRSFPGVSVPETPGETSRAVTEHLDVTLDHDTGEVSGRVLKGFFVGRRLESLAPAELGHLWQDCRAVDARSARIIEAFLDRRHPAWREDIARGEAEMASGPDGRMPIPEARRILGLKLGANEEEIRRAHRELIMRLHPDRGGSTYLAAKVNQAKDVLLQSKDMP